MKILEAGIYCNEVTNMPVPPTSTFLNKELEEHKDNGIAWALLASLQAKREQNGEALTCVNQGMKYLGKKDE